MYNYDIVMIGAGAAGLVASKLANGLGKKVAMIEKKKIGGDCTWFGCIPSKALIKSASQAHQLTRLGEFGLETKEPVELNAAKVMEHVRAVVQADADRIPPESFEAEGIDVLFGSGRFLDNHKFKLDQKVISSKKFIICCGSHPFVPSIEGLEEIDYLTNETIFDLEVLPKSMIVLGAGPIGIELSAALNRLGVKVTLLQRSSAILKKDDPELTARLLEILKDEGLVFLTNVQVKSFSRDGNKITAHFEDEENVVQQIEAESVLVAVGRRPSLEGLELEKAGVEFDSQGIIVDEHLRTTAKNIYAAGDVVPPYLFSHIAEYEAVIAGTNACLPFPVKKTNYDNILWCTFTEPELAHAGLTEAQARELYGDKIKIYRWEHKDVDRARTDLEQNGLTKIVCGPKGKILGIGILGHGAAEIMHEVQLAKSLNKPFYKIASVIHAYPSYSDAVRQPAKKCYIDILQNNFFIKLIKSLTSKKNRKRMILLLVVIVLLVGLRFTGIADKLTLGNLQTNAAKLRDFSNANYLRSVLIYIVVYIAVTSFSLPGATVLTLAGGFLYNFFVGAIYVNIAATTGAALAFLFARYIAGRSIQKRFGDKLGKFNEELDRNGASYLLTLRFIPLFPFFMINLLAGLTNVSFLTYLWTTSVGIFPGSLIYAYAGQQLGEIKSVHDIFTGGVLLAFILLAVFALIPVFYKKFKGKSG